MGEDVSSQIRTGITVILVAALITAVLNLMVVAQNIMANGLGTLESGTDQVAAQEFEKYNQKKVSGTSVKAAISLYEAKDICIVVRTKACKEGSTGVGAWGYQYGTLLLDANGSQPSSQVDADGSEYYYFTGNDAIRLKNGQSYYTAEYFTGTGGVLNECHNTRGLTTAGDPQFILTSARFKSFLIKNSTGTIVGIYFEQITG
ncbi:MAG: hypothetical protein HFI05_01905 [Lachnospiraceae bacterium]|jgi:hypothetical protein|nr:hypothetical protein [Lachnospiraceae bacterium]